MLTRSSFPAPLAALPVLALTLTLAGCSVNPATGKRQLSLISESQEVQIGRQADQEIRATLGLYPDEELQRYVQRVGESLAARSERPELPWTFRVVDDPVVNAFALPGGFIYVTRGLLTHLDTEAELAAVLGHEIGHVTGRHSVERLSKAQLTQLGLGLGMILQPELRNYGDLAQLGLGVLFLKFSRDDEREADDLGVRYIDRTQYDPREMIGVFSVLQRVSQAQGDGGRLPGWLATHPTPENRIERISGDVTALDGDFAGRQVGRERFLAQADNVTFGDNPREGYFKGNTFYHPEMAFKIDFPAGWETRNQKQAVGAISRNQDAVVVLTLSNRSSAETAAREFFSQSGVRQGGTARLASFTGLPGVASTFLVDRQQGEDLAGLAAFVEHRGKVFQLLGYTTEGRFRSYDQALESSLRSFSRVTDRRVLNVQPKRLDIVQLPRSMTLSEFARRYPSTVDLATLALINQVTEDARFSAGTRVKRVVGGELP